MPEEISKTRGNGDDPLTAVLLAGGRSSRMGRDKAGVLYLGEPLWERQLRSLRGISPGEVLISGLIDGPYANAGCRVIVDEEPGLGPLGGICTALRVANSPRLLVLAIDLPEMTPDFLRRLVRECQSGKGLVPRRGTMYEPLAAVYPRVCLDVALAHAHSEDRSMQRFVRAAIQCGFLDELEIDAEELVLFRNANEARDLRE